MSFDRRSPRVSKSKSARPARPGGRPEKGSKRQNIKLRDREKADRLYYGDERKPRKGSPRKSRNEKGPLSQREKSKEKRVKITKGPWGASAYLPSSLLDEKGRYKPLRQPAVKPRAPKVAKPTSLEEFGENKEATATLATNPPKEQQRNEERLQKVLARCGIASRRKAEMLILEGAVTVNGRPVTELGTKVDAAKDKIKVDGKLIFTEVEPIYLVLYKPKGVISALSDPEGRNHIGNLLHDVRERVIPVGRLDYNSEGLMLLTNDGQLANQILKARELPKIYMVKVKGHPAKEDLDFLQRGIFTADGVVRVRSFGVEQSLKSKSWIKLEVVEGSKLDLRELLNHRGLLVDRIVRTAIGPISIIDLQPGEYRFVKRQDFETLLRFANT